MRLRIGIFCVGTQMGRWHCWMSRSVQAQLITSSSASFRKSAARVTISQSPECHGIQTTQDSSCPAVSTRLSKHGTQTEQKSPSPSRCPTRSTACKCRQSLTATTSSLSALQTAVSTFAILHPAGASTPSRDIARLSTAWRGQTRSLCWRREAWMVRCGYGTFAALLAGWPCSATTRVHGSGSDGGRRMDRRVQVLVRQRMREGSAP
mmetsp:Transcript_37389/g.88397  ORF Transcript_37389/g.88397 Transcript_37389/m.88397 type:complete len:207 (+) Transcript_37389:407-1027(+)